MRQLQAQAEALIAKKAKAALDQIRELMNAHGPTTADIEAKVKARRERARTASTHATAKGKLLAKYLNPKTGETWSGHACSPAWIANVKDRTKFLVVAVQVLGPRRCRRPRCSHGNCTLSCRVARQGVSTP
jgi:DNA-binding protein H-NS